MYTVAKQKNNVGDILDLKLFKRLFRLAIPFKKQLISSVILAIVLSISGPLRPYLVQLTVDDYILRFDKYGLFLFSGLILLVLLIESVLRYYFSYTTSWLGQSVIKNLRVNIFSHIIHQRLKYFDNTPIGASTTRTINDTEAINSTFSEGIIEIFADLITLFTVMLFMFYQDWKLTLICLSTLPLLVISAYIFKEKVKTAFQIVRTQVSRLNTFVQEHISGMNIVQIFNAEEREMNKFIEINERHKKANIDTIFYYSVFFPVVEIILAASIGLLIWWGAHDVIAGRTTLGTLIAFILYINMLFRPIRMLADKFNTLQMGLVASNRVFNVLDRTEHIENNGTHTAEKINGNIVFDHVWFAYNDENYVLRNISFSLNSGESLAIVGATGSGKTSIINILNRFYEINKGMIQLDHINIKDYELNSLRDNISLVLQDIFLFSGSVYDNITLKNPNISLEQVIESAKMIGAHDFIEKLPGKYNYNVMERGATLSVGQRQLISFIRALVYNPGILILDEATSSIDTESEQMIQQATEKLLTNRTSIVIAHRLSTIRRADKIMVLDAGEIKEIGTHEELLSKGGMYTNLHKSQFQKTVA